VVFGRIDGIGSDGVGAQLLQLRDIASTGGLIGKRISVLGLWTQFGSDQPHISVSEIPTLEFPELVPVEGLKPA
jgi:hypothetical protein